MSLSLAFRLAWRYATSRSSSTVSTMVGVCFASIFVGTFALALTTAIMRGFEFETHKKLQSIYPSLIIKAPNGTTVDYEKLHLFLEKELHGIVTHTAPYLLRPALAHPATVEEPTCVITLKGVEPQQEVEVTALSSMISPATALADLHQQHVILGKDLAENLEASVGDQIVLLCNENDEETVKDATLRTVPVTVVGIISTGIADYDERLAIVPLSLCHLVWGPDCITYVGLKVAHPRYEERTLSFLQTLDGLEAYSWKDFYPSLVSALKLEKYVMFALLVLITLVASMNIISLLFMYITHKRTDIALLEMLGMSQKTVSLIFLLVSVCIATAAALAGLAAAWVAGLVLQRYPFIQLPDVYYVTHLPVTLEWSLFALVFVVVIGLSILTSLLPLKTISRLSITEILRAE